MIKTVITCLLFSGALSVLGQNQLDEQGRKSGHWKVDHPSGGTLYEAEFMEGRPVGEMIRYYENGTVRARMDFDSAGIKSYTRMFYPSGKLAAEGWFVNQLKDSVWTYYSPVDGTVRIREPYLKNNLHGMVQSYYPSGQISEEVQWVMGKKEGTWQQYYETGAPRLSGHHKDDLLSGRYEVFFSDGTIKVKGDFLNNLSHGIWSYFDESGEEIISLEYLNGIPVDREKFDQLVNDTLDKYQVPLAPESIPNFQ